MVVKRISTRPCCVLEERPLPGLQYRLLRARLGPAFFEGHLPCSSSFRVAALIVALGAFFPCSSGAQSSNFQTQAVERLLLAFDSADVVALSDHHLSKVDSDLRIHLVRHPDFPRKAQAIVVECGNALYQPLLDRYINGGDVPISQLQQVWQNTTQVGRVFDSPVYAIFLATVRDVNRRLPAAKRLRVFAGDPPIDWSKVKTNAEFQAIVVHRDDFPLSIIRDQILKNGQKALVIYGGAHLRSTASMVRGLEQSHPGKLFVYLIDPNVEDGVAIGPDPAIKRDEAEMARRRKIVFGH
jgi:hypothetical protein